MGTLMRAANLRGYADLVRELGGDPDALLGTFGLRAGIEDEEDAFVPLAAFAALLEESARTLECPSFGLRLSAWQGLDILGPVSVIARNSGTVHDAFTAIGRFIYVHSPALQLHEVVPATGADDPDRPITFGFSIVDPEAMYLDQCYELSLANGSQILRLLAGELGVPDLVAFRHPRISPEQTYRDVFGCEVVFEQDWSGFVVPASLAGHQIDNADPETGRLATRYLEQTTTRADEPLAGRVATLVRRLLPTGHADAETVAALLKLHPRTLQRRLAADGTRFADLLDRERRQRSVLLLAQSGLQVGQVSRMLGYSEQSAFTRAFVRWYGTSPGRYRSGVQTTTGISRSVRA